MSSQKIPSFSNIISPESLLRSWRGFSAGKKSKPDVAEFALRLVPNLLALHRELAAETYQHSGYQYFRISDPKPRDIHKALVRDRVLHHALYAALYPHFDRLFIHDSYSCRLQKGTQRAFRRFSAFAQKESLNHTKTVWVLKCDIRKCFASVDHAVLKEILRRHVRCKKTMRVLESIIDSFSSYGPGIGIPLGNLTSQLFINIYLNKLDQFMKRSLKAKWYIRYADDFVILSRDKDTLVDLLPKIGNFLETELKLSLHPDKISLRTFASGVDYLGWVHFPDHRVLRTVTRKRIMKAGEEMKENRPARQLSL